MKLPRTAQEIADVIGREAALRLIGQAHRYRPPSRGAEFVTLYVPRELRPDHHLVRVLGWTKARALVEAFSGMILMPGNCAHLYRSHRDRSLARLLSQGLSPKMLSEWFEVSERHVRNVAKAESLHVAPRAARSDARSPV